jgi:uncharacterized protein YndB with AHSA1/START domain
MNMTMQDTIERTLTVNAPMERVYRALTAELTNWFPKAIEGTVAAGQTVVFDFGKHGKCTTHIVAANPHDYFAYRWIPGVAFEGDIYARPNTLVEFRLREVDGGTEVNLVESGFASLPKEDYEMAFKNNSEGWDEELGNLVKYVQS